MILDPLPDGERHRVAVVPSSVGRRDMSGFWWSRLVWSGLVGLSAVGAGACGAGQKPTPETTFELVSTHQLPNDIEPRRAIRLARREALGSQEGLRIATWERLNRPMVSLNIVGVRNQGSVQAVGWLTVDVTDSNGVPIAGVLLENSGKVSLPAKWGVRVLRLDPEGNSRRLLDSLIASDRPFGLRASAYQNGLDGPVDVQVVEWRKWDRLTPGSYWSPSISAAAAATGSRSRGRLRAFYSNPGSAEGAVPPEISVHESGSGAASRTLYARAAVAKSVEYGMAIGIQFDEVSAANGAPLQSRTRWAAYDTLPPQLTSYRVVLLPDSRLAIQVRALDVTSGLDERAVSTVFSVDGGKTWNRKRHRMLDDFSDQPSVFEASIGPLERRTLVLVGVEAADRVGNATSGVPEFAAVLAAPAGAEAAFEYYERAALHRELGILLGNAIFQTSLVDRAKEWRAIGQGSDDANAISGSEESRRAILDSLIYPFRQRRLAASMFKPVKVASAKAVANSRSRSYLVLKLP